jgi:pSer/pThr/pTyr-binding forkhead associated (FHA) protein
MQVVLVMFRAEGDKRSFSVTRDVTVIGRREDCDLRIPVSEVSRKHCRIIKDGDSIRAEDLGSSNGTFHNGQRISGSVELAPGDSVQVGPVVFVLQIDGNPPDDELAPFEDRAAHHLDDSVATPPPPEYNEPDANTAGENLEMLEPIGEEIPLTDAEPTDESGAPLPMADAAEESGAAIPMSHGDESGAPIPLHDSNAPLSLHVDEDEHAASSPGTLSEDDLLLDLNSPDEHGKK